MKTVILLLPLLLAGCTSQPPKPEAAKAPADAERRTESATFWSSKTELYLENPELVLNEESRFAIHLTRLDDFKPVAAGRCEVRLVYKMAGLNRSPPPLRPRPGSSASR